MNKYSLDRYETGWTSIYPRAENRRVFLKNDILIRSSCCVYFRNILAAGTFVFDMYRRTSGIEHACVLLYVDRYAACIECVPQSKQHLFETSN